MFSWTIPLLLSSHGGLSHEYPSDDYQTDVNKSEKAVIPQSPVHRTSGQDGNNHGRQRQKEISRDGTAPNPKGPIASKADQACHQEIALQSCAKMLWSPSSERAVHGEGRAVHSIRPPSTPERKPHPNSHRGWSRRRWGVVFAARE